MSLKDFEEKDLDQILSAPAVRLIATNNRWITSHDLAGALKKISQAMGQFATDIESAIEKLGDTLES